MSRQVHKFMRVAHRYLGFFLLIIMVIYAISGVVLIYRDTLIFKKEIYIEKTIEPQLAEQDLAKALKIKAVKVKRIENDIIYFQDGNYNRLTGEARYTTIDYPPLLKSLVLLHKGNSSYRYSWLTTLFGVALFFFAISAFWMFPATSKTFKKGILAVGLGTLFALFILFV